MNFRGSGQGTAYITFEGTSDVTSVGTPSVAESTPTSPEVMRSSFQNQEVSGHRIVQLREELAAARQEFRQEQTTRDEYADRLRIAQGSACQPEVDELRRRRNDLQEEIQAGRRSFALAAEEGINGARESVAEARRLQDELRSVGASKQKQESEVDGLRRRRVEPLKMRNEELRVQLEKMTRERQLVECRARDQEKEDRELEQCAEHLRGRLQEQQQDEAGVRELWEVREAEAAELSCELSEQAMELRKGREALNQFETEINTETEAAEKVVTEENSAMELMEAETEAYRENAAHDNSATRRLLLWGLASVAVVDSGYKVAQYFGY